MATKTKIKEKVTQKKGPKKPKAKVGKKAQSKKEPKAKIKSATGGLLVPVFDITGRAQGTISLPGKFFGVKSNKALLAQALRVYFANQSGHTASTKTRAEVRGGGAKPWKQKGTGRARAGTRRSPLWVGGGVTFGPRPTKAKLALPKKMKRKALIAALSQKRLDGAIKIISNFEKMQPKTKIAANLLKRLAISGKTTLVLDDRKPNVKLAVRNIPNTSVETSDNLNAYKVLSSKNLLFSKGAIEKFKS
ncbi:50S ribosomal protein L4 [Candidatus Curtissbacteria bacterium]|nr:50S ribosomal protein L4 [Candidatus Curtissbacteria bacterium]